jgi:transposase
MPKLLIRVVGQAPLQATVYEVEKMRCNLCGKIFTAPIPEGIGEEKYDETCASMIALLKYGSGLPFYRMQRLQAGLGVPVPASTQWEIVEAAADKIYPAYEELVRQAAQGEVLHNDDTGMKVLALMKENQTNEDSEARTGMFTSGIVSTQAGRKIALFFTGRKHAGENLADLLKERSAHLELPIQMCDALSRNTPKGAKTQLANCLAHSRRKFVEVATSFPDQCRHVLKTLGKVYKYDAVCKEQEMTPGQRLQFHQVHSGPLMEKLRKWLTAQLEEKKVEPKSGLGEAISYLLTHWDKLTLFLKVPGAPLDNNLCEQALKKAILHRKNALFYKTEHGAYIGDLFMSLIYTCELSDANSFDYLTALQRHSKEVFANPANWMPWNYRDATSQATPAPQA